MHAEASGKTRGGRLGSTQRLVLTGVLGLLILGGTAWMLSRDISAAHESLSRAAAIHSRLDALGTIAQTWVANGDRGAAADLPDSHAIRLLLGPCLAAIDEFSARHKDGLSAVADRLRRVEGKLPADGHVATEDSYASQLFELRASLGAGADEARLQTAVQADALANSERTCFLVLALMISAYVVALCAVAARHKNAVVGPVESLTDALHRNIETGHDLAAIDDGPIEVQQLSSAVLSFAARCTAAAEHRSNQVTAANDKLRLLNVTLQKEIRRRESIEEQLRHDAGHDALTQLPNRHLMLDRIEYLVERSKRDPRYRFAVLFLDLDNFKHVNDTLGHRAGDALLVDIALRLSTCLRSLDVVGRRVVTTTARLGGDEFVILLDDIADAGDAIHVAERIQNELARPMEIENHPVTLGASIGIAVSDGRTFDCEELLRDADTAMYRAKRGGKSQHAIFDVTMHTAERKRFELEGQLRCAIERNEFELFYQPIVALRGGRLQGFEALLRWRHPAAGLMAPCEFVPLAEETGLIVPIGEWVFKEACRQLDEWHTKAPSSRLLSMSINVARRQLLVPGFLEMVDNLLMRSNVPARQINLEVTEGTVMEVAYRLPAILDQIKELGVNIHMDDFGTGHSSLSCLHSFPVDVLKIDRAFVTTAGQDRGNTGILAGVMAMARSLDMKVVAEGIECADSLDAVVSLDCDFGQGYFFSRPIDAIETLKLIRSGATWSQGDDAEAVASRVSA